jgi:uncharacterized protein Yka (UPF0111/DUF47 family)
MLLSVLNEDDDIPLRRPDDGLEHRSDSSSSLKSRVHIRDRLLPAMDRGQLLRELETRLREARDQRDSAATRFGQVFKQIPRASDEQIRAATQEYSDAIDALDQALAELSDFLAKEKA